MDIIKFIESKKKVNTYFKGDKTLKRNVYWLEDFDLETIKEQLLIIGVGSNEVALPFDFIKWYSGMEKYKIMNAYNRWLKER